MKVGERKSMISAPPCSSTNSKPGVSGHGRECDSRIVPAKLVRLRISHQLVYFERERKLAYQDATHKRNFKGGGYDSEQYRLQDERHTPTIGATKAS